jgi:Protein of unknown function (DUF1579)
VKIGTAAVAVSLVVGSAQTPQRAPGPEHARLESLAGQWTIEGESRGDRFTRSETCEWFTGHFHLICQSEAAGATGVVKGQSIIGYDSDAKNYTFYFISSIGTSVFMRGTVTGDVWTWSGELRVGGEVMKVRTTITDQSPTSYLFKMEGSFADGPWMLLEEGRGTKAR